MIVFSWVKLIMCYASTHIMRDCTLCFVRKDDKILLGMKKRGFGKGKYNGFGGKKEDNETIHDAAIRELREESGILTNVKSA